MTKEERWKHIEILSDLRAKYSYFEESEEPYYRALSAGIKALKQEPCEEWIHVKTRPLTEEEKQEYGTHDFEFIYDCPLPDDGQEVFITTKNGYVAETTFFNEGIDGCYFEYYEDDGDVIAWMPKSKPKSYKAESEVTDADSN